MKRLFSGLILSIAWAWPLLADEELSSQQPKADAQHGTSTDVENSHLNSHLTELGWMVGRWVDRGDEVTVTTHCEWTHGGKFLSRSFVIAAKEEPTLEGTQVIGWDPIAEEIRSWTFDSAGGFGSGRWVRDGNRWLVQKSFVLAGGERASAINVITFVNENTLRWQSTNREIAGEIQPSIPEVTVVRISDEEDGAQPENREESK